MDRWIDRQVDTKLNDPVYRCRLKPYGQWHAVAPQTSLGVVKHPARWHFDKGPNLKACSERITMAAEAYYHKDSTGRTCG